jgi:TolB-like protein/cytochrome c-type biogenesis protein CcmH/NrfG
MSFFQELKRRNVFRVGIAYVLGAWVLLQVIDFALQVIAAPDWILQVFFLAATAGLGVALVAAWIFEVTPEGIRRESSIQARADKFISDRGQAIVTDTGEEAAEPLNADSRPAAPIEKSIAVLPFENRSPKPEDEFFADGMHDELLTHLSRISGMRVISRTSVLGYAGTDRKIPEIARELGVATVMEGSVQRAGKRVRINVQLIDAQADVHLWAEIYDRELSAENIFEIQSEITKAIAASLNSALSSDNEADLQARPTQSLAAYDAYIAGRLLFNSLTESGFRQAIDRFETALAADPEFAAAWSAKSEALMELYWLFDIGSLDLVEAAREALDRATTLAPDTVETLSALAHYYYYVLLDYKRAISAFERVLDRAPNHSRAWAGKGFAMRRAGRFEEAIAALERAHSLDPLAIDPMDGVFSTNLFLGNIAQAKAMLEKMKAIAPTNPNTVIAESDLYFYTGDVERSAAALDLPISDPGPWFYRLRLGAAVYTRDEAVIEEALNDWPERFHSLRQFPELYNLGKAEALLALGRDEEGNRLLNQIKARDDSSENPYPHGWSANARYLPVDLPGLMGDLDAVNGVVAAYEADLPGDIYSRYDLHYFDIARAYALAGDEEAALDYLEKQLLGTGPAKFIGAVIDPAFDSLRDHPRYRAMQEDYESWLKSSQP